MRYLTSHTTNDILNTYTPLDQVGVMQRYFNFIQPLLDVIAAKAAALGFIGATGSEVK